MNNLEKLVTNIVNTINDRRKETQTTKIHCSNRTYKSPNFFYYHENFIIKNKPYAIRVRGNDIYIEYISITDPLMPYGRRTIRYVENINCKNKYEFIDTLFKHIIKSIK